MKKQYKALSLLSGGLDSQLAICLLKEQGIHVEAITYLSPFFGVEKGQRAAEALGVKHHVIDYTEEILDLVRNPPHGLGKAMNPCIDCHTFMIKKAGDLLEEWGFDFIATGEVMGQRPMSQNKQSLGVVARCSEYEDLIVRPLCAPLLPPTKPIREGWIDVNKLPSISGRNRTQQMKMAEEYGLKDYPAPAGGCLLTEQRFGWKLKDLLDHEGLDEDRLNVWLLPTGRHMRLADDVKIIVGTCKEDNDLLEEKAPATDVRITCPELPSPLIIAPANTNEEQLKTSAAICARYAKTPSDQSADVQITKDGESYIISVMPMNPDEVNKLLVASPD